MKRLTLLLLLVIANTGWIFSQKTIKVLAIGNSFAVDAVEQYLYELGQATGDSLVIGYACISGCSLEKHWNNVVHNKSDYEFKKIIGGGRTEYQGRTLLECIENENWDYITFQQSSANSGIFETYFPYLSNLIEYVKKHSMNNDVKFAFHLTWAYAQNSTHHAFPTYGSNQLAMYEAIIKTVTEATRKAGIELIIPTGIAIQKGRTSFLGDTFCRDGYHLNFRLGRYTAACTWYEFLTGKNVIGNKCIPADMDSCSVKVAQSAAHYAVHESDL